VVNLGPRGFFDQITGNRFSRNKNVEAYRRFYSHKISLAATLEIYRSGKNGNLKLYRLQTYVYIYIYIYISQDILLRYSFDDEIRVSGKYIYIILCVMDTQISILSRCARMSARRAMKQLNFPIPDFATDSLFLLL